MIRKAPKTIARPAVVATHVGNDPGISPVGIVLELVSKVTGPPIAQGTCDQCHYQYKDSSGTTEVLSSPAFSPASQIVAKAAISLGLGVFSSLIFGGRIATIAGLVLGNLAARPIVNAIATASGPATPPPKDAQILPAAGGATA